MSGLRAFHQSVRFCPSLFMKFMALGVLVGCSPASKDGQLPSAGVELEHLVRAYLSEERKPLDLPSVLRVFPELDGIMRLAVEVPEKQRSPSGPNPYEGKGKPVALVLKEEIGHGKPRLLMKAIVAGEDTLISLLSKVQLPPHVLWNQVRVVRQFSGNSTSTGLILVCDIAEYYASGALEQNPTLFSGDVIVLVTRVLSGEGPPVDMYVNEVLTGGLTF